MLGEFKKYVEAQEIHQNSLKLNKISLYICLEKKKKTFEKL